MHFEVRDHRLWIDGKPARFVESPNVGGRIEPTGVLYHDTADRLKPDDTVSWFRTPASKVSAHLVVGRDGSVVQMVPFDRAAWHAGKSSWNGRSGCNGFMIGIEVDNPGKLTVRGEHAYAWFGEAFPLADCVVTDSSSRTHGAGAWLPYTDAQIAVVEGISRALAAAYPTIAGGAGHYEVSPGRKVDPGPHFPMARMRAALGARRAPDRELIMALQERLADLRYPVGDADGIVGARTRAAIRAFQEQNGLDITGALDQATVTALRSPAAKGLPLAHREELTRDDVAESGSSTIATAAAVKRSAEVAGAITLGVAAADEEVPAPEPVSIDALPDFETVVTAIERERGLGERVLGLIDWAQTPRGLTTIVVVAGLTLIWALANQAEWRRVLKARLGLA